MVYNPNGKGMVYERLFFQVVIVMVKDKKTIINDTMSIKISSRVYIM